MKIFMQACLVLCPDLRTKGNPPPPNQLKSDEKLQGLTYEVMFRKARK